MGSSGSSSISYVSYFSLISKLMPLGILLSLFVASLIILIYINKYIPVYIIYIPSK